MKTYDIVIIGGGMVGLTLAARLADSRLRIAVVEAFPPQIPTEQVTERVSALNSASRNLLEELGVWQPLAQLRVTAYAQMQVWEKDSFAEIEFDGKNLGISHLGHIVENHLIQHQLWQQVQQHKNIEILTALPTRMNIADYNAIIALDNNELLSTKLIVGADGANSWVRKQAGIPLSFRDYGQHALVCNVETAEAHQNIARQIFAPDSILAFLPLHQQNLCSIVWSLSPESARDLTSCDENEFNKILTVAFDSRLGLCNVVSARKTFPLTARYARNFAQNRIVLVGDAAHTIHPLAGLGANLGFQDAAYLAQQIEKNLALDLDIGKYRALRNYERSRKTEAAKMLVTMQALKELFNGANPVKKLIRGIGLNATNQFDIIKNQLISEALGL